MGFPFEAASSQAARRYRQFSNLLKTEGVAGIGTRTRGALAQWLAPRDSVMPVRPADVMAADLLRPHQPAVPPVEPGKPIAVNWVMTPPCPGSGGHSTIFRILKYLEAHGYSNAVYFYDVYGSDLQYFSSIIRQYYGFHGPVASVGSGMRDAHAVVATAWPTAYPVFNARSAGKRFYFIQDFEPSFHAVGALSALAENTYRMGFFGITAGSWLAGRLGDEFAMEAKSFEFGCDLSHYHRQPGTKRSGVCFYARPETARRGFELGIMALGVFARRCPGADIHFYGEKIGPLPFRFIDHGRVTPGQLNDIYNRSYAGLSLSLTNVSLVPHEMLAAGCIPVVNDAPQNAMVLNNPFVRYAPLTPHALADALESLVTMADFDTLSGQAAASVRGTSWDVAGAQVDAIFREALKE